MNGTGMRLFAVPFFNTDIYRFHYNFKSIVVLRSLIRNYLVVSER